MSRFEQDILGGIVWSFLGQGWWLSLGSYASHEECAASLGSHGFVASLPRLGIVVPSWHELFGRPKKWFFNSLRYTSSSAECVWAALLS